MTPEPTFSLSEYHRLPQESLPAEFYRRQLEVVCNNATLALFIMDEHQQCVYMNPAAEKLTGYRLSETRGRALHDVIHHTRPDGCPYPLCECPIDQAFPQNNQEQGEEVFVHRDGHFYPVAYTASPIRENGRPIGTIIEVRDLTQEKLQEQVAKQAEEMAQRQAAFLAEASAILSSSLDYEQTLQSIADLVVPHFADWCGVDLLNDDLTISRVAVAHTNPEKVKFAWEIAQRFPRHLNDGYGISQVIKSGKSEIASHITDEQLTATIQNEAYLQILRDLGLKSAIIAPLKAHGQVLGSLSFVSSESGRHYRHADLLLAEDLARRAAIAIDNARLFREAQQSRQSAEKVADRMTRLQAVTAALSESLTPQQVAEVIVEQSIATLEATAVLVVLLSKDEKELEIVKSVGYPEDLVDSWRRFSISTDVPIAEAIRTKKPLWVEDMLARIERYPHLAEIYSQYDFKSWFALPLVIDDRSMGGMLLSFKEFKFLTQDDRDFVLALSRQCAQAIFRAQLYDAEHDARAEAERANRVKDEFLAVLSHELRSPLNPILGWSRLLQSRKLDDEKVNQALKIIERNARLQAELIEDLLDVSRILRGKLSLNVSSVDLTTTIRSAIETVRLAAEAKSIQIETRLSEDAAIVLGDSNRLQQIVWNLLSNAVKFTPEGGKVNVQLDCSGSQAQIIVRDTGKGIAPDFLPHVFDYFRQADSTTTRTFGGLGLGLAIVRQLVELHGGAIHADSQGEGQGATFTVRLPLMSNAPPLNQEGIQSAPFLSLDSIKVLVVDDDADALDYVAFLLEQEGAIVMTATSAPDALAALTQFQPDILLSDIGMPNMDGYMLMRQVRSLLPEQGGKIPAIALTAYAGEYDQQQVLKVGFQKHISKPVEPETLVKAIFELV